jgi:hypothetical protein
LKTRAIPSSSTKAQNVLVGQASDPVKAGRKLSSETGRLDQVSRSAHATPCHCGRHRPVNGPPG